MKHKSLLTLSLVFNIILITLLLTRRPQVTGPEHSQKQVQGNIQHAASTGMQSNTSLKPLLPIEKFYWSSLESSDYKEYIRNLRQIGCPEETIKDLIICEISKLFTQKKQQTLQKVAPWAHTQPNAPRQQALRALEDEERALIKDLLGVDLLAEQQRLFGGFAIGTTLQRLTLEWLPLEKQSAMRDLLQKYDNLEKDLRIAANNVLLKEDRDKIRELKAQKRQELAALLSPDELISYDMRTSDTSAIISALSRNGFNYTEDEFKKIFSVYRNNDPYHEFTTGSSTEAVKENQQNLETQLQSALGLDRYSQYQKANDPAYGAINRVITRLNLDQSKTDVIFQIKNALDDAHKTLSASGATSDIIESRTREMKDAAKAAVQNIIGESGYQMMLENGSVWLK